MSASKFEEISDHNSMPSISSFFNKKNKTETTTNNLSEQVPNMLTENEKHGRLSCAKENTKEANEGTCFASNPVPEGRDEEHPGERDNSVKNDKEGINRGKTACNSKLSEISCSEKKGIEVFFSGKPSSERKLKNSEGPSRPNPYLGCEIDSAVLESLPEEIRREIKISLVRSNRGAKTGKELNNFFGPRESASGKESTSLNETPNTIDNDGFSDDGTLLADCIDLQKCEKCGQRLPDWEMPEHLDYHFALELQNVERNSTAATKSELSIKEPPKKKQRTTIQSFFTPK